MEQFCKSLHPVLKDGTICINWLRQAADKCTELMQHPTNHYINIWGVIKSIMFPKTDISVMGFNISISAQPNDLTVKDCEALFINVFHEYILISSRYTTEREMNAVIWQGIVSLLSVSIMGLLLMIVHKAYNKYKITHKEYNSKTINKLDKIELCKAEAVMPAVTNLKKRIIQNDFKSFHIHHLLQRQCQIFHDIQYFYAQKTENGNNNVTAYNNETITASLGSLMKFPSILRLLVVFNENNADELKEMLLE